REREVAGAYLITAREIGDGPRDAEHAVKTPRRQSATTHGFGRECLGVACKPAVTPHLRDRKLRIAAAAGAGEPRAHTRTRCDDALADRARGFATVLPELLICDARDVNA